MEIWKSIQGYEGIYECSSLGKIRSLDRYVFNSEKQIYFFIKGQELKLRKNKNGYLQVGLNKDGKRKMVYVHRIIAEIFLESGEGKNTVNHIDGDKNNNCVDNLEWCSYSENNKHSYKELNRKIVNCGGSKIPIYMIDTKTKELFYYKSIAEASKLINLSHTQINRYVHSNKKWKGRFILLTDKDKGVENNEKV